MFPENDIPAKTNSSMSDDEVLDFTKTQRINVVKSIFVNDKVPEDPALIKVGLAALDGLSRDSLTKRRLEIESKVGDAAARQADAAKLIAEVLRHSRSTTIYEGHEFDTSPLPTLGSNVPIPILVRDETAINPAQLTYDIFVSSDA